MYPFVMFQLNVKGIKQCKLADKIGMNRDTFYKKWIGQLRFSRYEMYKIQKELDCHYIPIEVLFMGKEESDEFMKQMFFTCLGQRHADHNTVSPELIGEYLNIVRRNRHA